MLQLGLGLGLGPGNGILSFFFFFFFVNVVDIICCALLAHGLHALSMSHVSMTSSGMKCGEQSGSRKRSARRGKGLACETSAHVQ